MATPSDKAICTAGTSKQNLLRKFNKTYFGKDFPNCNSILVYPKKFLKTGSVLDIVSQNVQTLKFTDYTKTKHF